MGETAPGKKQKNHSLTEEVAEKLEREKYGQASLLIENLVRRYYGMAPYDFDKLNEETRTRFHRNILGEYRNHEEVY